MKKNAFLLLFVVCLRMQKSDKVPDTLFDF